MSQEQVAVSGVDSAVEAQSVVEAKPVGKAKFIVTPPRAFLFDCLLIFGTFGFYLPFWMAGQVRDIKKISTNSLTPCLWFFVPFFWLVQLKALPDLNRILSKQETRFTLPNRKGLFTVWVVCVILLSIVYTISARYSEVSVPSWLFTVVSLSHSALFSLLALRTMKIKAAALADHSILAGKKYHWWEWLVIALGVPFCLFVVYIYANDALTNKVIARYQPGSEFVDSVTGLSFPIEGVIWRQVENDISGDAAFSFSGPNLNFDAYIFEYTNEKVNDLVYNRYVRAMQIADDFDCSEEKVFIAGTTFIRSEQICMTEGIIGVDGALSVFIETPEKMYELYIDLYSSETMDSSLVRSVVAAAKGFSIQ
jgi:Ca2+/Na+ antiporter